MTVAEMSAARVSLSRVSATRPARAAAVIAAWPRSIADGPNATRWAQEERRTLMRPVVSVPVRMTAAQAMALPAEHHVMVRVSSRYMCEACDLVTHDLTRVAAHVVRTQFVVRDAR